MANATTIPTTATTIPTTSLSIAQSIAKIETKAEFKNFMVSTLNYDKKLSPSQIVRSYCAKTGNEVEDTDDFKAVLSFIAKDSDINTQPEAPEALPIVENSDINTSNEAIDDEKAAAEAAAEAAEKKYLDKIECIKGKLKLRPVGDELINLAIDYSPLFARLKKGVKLTNIEVASELYPIFDTLQISVVLNCHKGGIEKSLKEKGLYTGTGVTRTKSEGTGEGEKKPKVVLPTSALSVEQIKQGIRVKFDLIDTLLRDISLDKKILDIREGVEAEMSKAKAKATLSNNVQNMKNAGFSIEDMLAMIEAMKDKA